MYGSQKAVTPKLGIHPLAIAASLGEQYRIGRKIFVFTSQSITKPGPHGRAVSLLDSGLKKSKRRIMVNGLGMHGFDDADIINYFGSVRKKFTDPGSGLPILLEIIYGAYQRKRALTGGHAGQYLSLAHGFRQFFAPHVPEQIGRASCRERV